MQKVVRIAAFTSILLVTIAAVIGEQTSSIEPTVPYEALTISPGKVEGTKKQSVTPLPLRADLQQITKNKQTPEVRSQYRRQKAKDDARGINNLGKMLLNGVDRDLVEAFNLFTLAARAGDAEAINNLGQMYEMGWGTPADTKTAIELYAKALRKGSSAARKNFRRLTHAAAISDRESSARLEAAVDRRRPLSATTQHTGMRTSQITSPIGVFASSNPQAAQGGDRDDTDFRGVSESYGKRKAGCLFCEMEEPRVIASNALCYAIRDKFPVTEHHTLIIPKRHVSDFFELYQPEINAVHSLLGGMKQQVEELDSSATGFNVGMNSGEAAGQTVFHCHVHLIPRRKGDVENPRGGVRGVIPEKRIY